MMRQAHNQLGRIVNSFQTVVFISALLIFIFTVVYRMVKSASFINAMATLVESLLIVFFFIFLGILLAYLICFIYQRFRQESRRQEVYNLFASGSGHGKPAAKSDPCATEFASDDEIESSPDSA